MARRVKQPVEPTQTMPGTGGVGSRPQPPKAVARSASLEATRSVPDHATAKQRLTRETVAGPPAKA